MISIKIRPQTKVQSYKGNKSVCGVGGGGVRKIKEHKAQ